MKRKATKIVIIVLLILVLSIFINTIQAGSVQEYDDIPDLDSTINIPAPSGYRHRPLIEFFTGLSCPSCMNGPHYDLDKLWDENYEDPEQPFNFVVFHELNGGGEDDLATADSKERMRHYQPGVSGTPDTEFDGGYIELGGMTGGTLNYNTAVQAVEDSKERYKRNINPRHPLQSLGNNFKYVDLFVDQIYNGDSYAINVQVHYLGSNAILPYEQLRASLYVFMVEENVEAFSTVEGRMVINRNVFRDYAIKGQEFTLSNDDTFITTVEWKIPEAKVPIRPGNLTAVAAIYDLDDTSSQEGNQGNNAQVPRCIQSANPASSAFDRENDLPVISKVNTVVDRKITVNAKIDDIDGISKAVVLYNFEAPNSTRWSYAEMNLTGEEVCDDAGVCYAYGDSTASTTIEVSDSGNIYLMILAYDGSGIESGGLGAEGRSSIYDFTISKGVSSSEADGQFSMGTVFLILGILLVLIIAIFLFVSRGKQKANGSENGSMFGTLKKNRKMFFMFIALIILAMIIGSIYLLSMRGGEKAPDFTLTDIDGNEFSLSDFEGKVVVIDFMAVSCGPCNDAMPDLRAIYEKYGDDIVMISIDVYENEDEDQLREFMNKHKATWIFARDTDDLKTKYNIVSIPKIVIIEENGGVTFSHVGAVPESTLTQEVEKALGGGAALVSLGSTPLGLAGFAVVVGVGSFFSPCSFPLLPGYMSYYMGLDKSRSIRRALMGGGAAALGLVLLYMLLGVIVGISGSAITPYIPVIEPFVGVIIVFLGIVMLTNYTIPFSRITEPVKKMFVRKKEPSNLNSRFESAKKKGYMKLFWYGVGYAGAAAGCTAPLLLALIFTAFSSGNFFTALLIFLILASVMAALMVLVTILIAMSAGTLLQKLKVSTAWIKRISGIILIVVGVYLVAYYSIVF